MLKCEFCENFFLASVEQSVELVKKVRKEEGESSRVGKDRCLGPYLDKGLENSGLSCLYTCVKKRKRALLSVCNVVQMHRSLCGICLEPLHLCD